MKLEVYEETKTKTEEPVRLRLVREGGAVYLNAVDKAGKTVDDGHLLIFGDDGTVTFCEGVNPDLGFRLDENGEIIAD